MEPPSVLLRVEWAHHVGPDDPAAARGAAQGRRSGSLCSRAAELTQLLAAWRRGKARAVVKTERRRPLLSWAKVLLRIRPLSFAVASFGISVGFP